MGKTIFFIAASFFTVFATPASAQAPASRAVSSDNLDLFSRAGRAMLNRRIATAVEAVCGSYAGVSSYETREIDRCRAAARTGAETRLAGMQSHNMRIALGFR